MNQLPFGLKPSDLGSQLGATRPTWRTPHGILKKCQNEGEAEHEARSLASIASINVGVRYPQLRQHEGHWLLIEDVGSFPLSAESDFLKAADYMVKLHSVEVTSSIETLLLSRRQCHYSREPLVNRIRQECEFAQKAGAILPLNCVREFCQLTGVLAYRPLPANSEVAGHGDFQVKNLVKDDAGVICAVDWHDFGLCYRFYEIAHFLNSVPSEHYCETEMRYKSTAEVKDSDWYDGLRYGMAIDYVIRAGSDARLVASDPDRHARNFVEHVENLKTVMTALP